MRGRWEQPPGSRPLDPCQFVESVCRRSARPRPCGVERGVDLGCRVFASPRKQDPEVLRQVEPLQLAPVARAQLRPVGEEERDVGADSRGNAPEPFWREWIGKRLVGEPERGRRVGAAATETGGDRDPLLDPDAPIWLDFGHAGELFQRVADERVARKTLDQELGRLLQLDPVDEIDPLHGEFSCLPS